MPIELGESVVLVCRVAGIASSIPVSYEWSCPNKGCNIGAGQYPNRQANGNTLVINVLSVEDAGSYECAVKNISSDVVLERATYELKISGELCQVYSYCTYVSENGIHGMFDLVRVYIILWTSCYVHNIGTSANSKN